MSADVAYVCRRSTGCNGGPPGVSSGTPTVIVGVDGQVRVDCVPLGWVDRYDRRLRSKPAATWRWVIGGGEQSTVRFATRRAAVAALLAHTGRTS